MRLGTNAGAYSLPCTCTQSLTTDLVAFWSWAADTDLLLQLEYAAALATLERARIMAETKERHADDVLKDVELAGVEKEKILAEQVDLDMRMQVNMQQAG